MREKKGNVCTNRSAKIVVKIMIYTPITRSCAGVSAA